MVCHAVLSRRRGDNHSFSLRRKLEIIASRERQPSTLAFTQQGMNSITQVLFTKCYSSSEAVCFFFVICQVCSFAAELVEQQGCRKSKTLKKILSAWLSFSALLPMSCCSGCQSPRQSLLAELLQRTQQLMDACY